MATETKHRETQHIILVLLFLHTNDDHIVRIDKIEQELVAGLLPYYTELLVPQGEKVADRLLKTTIQFEHQTLFVMIH